MTERVAVVTGAQGRIGRLIVAGLRERGYAVVGLDRPQTIGAGEGGGAHRIPPAVLSSAGRSSAVLPTEVLACDVSDEEQVGAAIARIEREHGRIDLLVLSAGLSAIGSFTDHDLSVHRQVMDATHFGAVACLQAAHPLLRATGGRVVLIGSVTGFAPVLGRPAYVAAKHAVTGLVEALRPELAADGIAVTVVHPTFVTGGMSEAAPRGAAAQRAVTGQEITASDVAEATIVGIERDSERVFVGRTARLAWIASRHTPRLYRRLMVRRMGSKETS